MLNPFLSIRFHQQRLYVDFFFSSRRRHTRLQGDWSSDVCSSDLSRPEGFRVISGDDSLTLALIALGGEGLISVASNEAPALMSELNDLALAGNWDDARKLHYRLLPLMEANFIESSPGPVKAAMALMGLLEENLRLPLVPVQEKTRTRLREVLDELGLLKETSHAIA